MKPLSRYGTNKARSAGSFRAQTMRTKKINMAPPPMRGGYRL